VRLYREGPTNFSVVELAMVQALGLEGREQKKSTSKCLTCKDRMQMPSTIQMVAVGFNCMFDEMLLPHRSTAGGSPPSPHCMEEPQRENASLSRNNKSRRKKHLTHQPMPFVVLRNVCPPHLTECLCEIIEPAVKLQPC